MSRSTRGTAEVYLGDICITMRGTYYPGCGETPPSYGSGGEPAESSYFDIDWITIGGVDAGELWEALTPATRDKLTARALTFLDEA